MIMYFTQEDYLNIDMKYYIEGMLEEFPYDIKSNKKDTTDRKVAKIPIRRQESQQIVAQHISHLRDESNCFFQEVTTQYIPRNFISILISQGR